MELQTMLFFLLACESLSKGSSLQFRAMPGVNSRKGSTRKAQSFHCTNTAKDSTTTRKLPMTTDSTDPTAIVCPDGSLMINGECSGNHECYNNDLGRVIHDGDTYANENCTKKCTCTNTQLSCDSYTCSPDATCKVEDDVRRCYCNDGYVGDGETCKVYTDCNDAYKDGHRQDGVFTILPQGWPGVPFSVRCDMTTSGGGWTILQRRPSEGVFGNRNWHDYKLGFGSPYNKHWIGNDKIFHLANQRNYRLRVDLDFSNGSKAYQEYSLFKIANENDNYRLIELGNSSGNAGDGMKGSLSQQFSTSDRDNDECDDIDCSVKHGKSGWWHSKEWCNECCYRGGLTCFYQISSRCKKRCTNANLNGWYNNAPHLSWKIFWNGFHNIVSTEMKIRP